MTAVQTTKPRLINMEVPGTMKGQLLTTDASVAFGASTSSNLNDQNLQAAMAMSLADHNGSSQMKEDDNLQLAMLLSMEGQNNVDFGHVRSVNNATKEQNPVNEDEELQL